MRTQYVFMSRTGAAGCARTFYLHADAKGPHWEEIAGDFLTLSDERKRSSLPAG